MNSIGDEDALGFYWVSLFLSGCLGVWDGKWRSKLGIDFLAGKSEGNMSELSFLALFILKKSF